MASGFSSNWSHAVIAVRPLKSEFPKRKRDAAFAAEVTQIVHWTAHEAIGTVGCDYWFHLTIFPRRPTTWWKFSTDSGLADSCWPYGTVLV